MKIKDIFIKALLSTSIITPAFAADMPVTSEIYSTCLINIGDVNFGVLEQATSVSHPLKLRCNKNTSLVVTMRSKNNPEGFSTGFMTMNGEQIPQTGNVPKPENVGIRYYFSTLAVQNNADYTIIRRPTEELLLFKIHPIVDDSMQMRVLTGNFVSLPLQATIHSNYKSKLFVPGVYYDISTVGIEF